MAIQSNVGGPMKRINAFVAVPRPLLQELKEQRREQREQRRDEREQRRDEREAQAAVSEKPGMDAASRKSRKLVEDSLDFDPLKRQLSTIDGIPRRMMSTYFDEESDLEDLESQGYVILGAWSTETGEQIRKPHRQLKRFMPPRLVTSMGLDGEPTTEEIDDETMQQIVLLFGQKERSYV